MPDFDETLIPILDYRVKQPLQDLFAMEDGSRVTTREQWEQRRKELFKTAVEIQYGTLPPDPEFLEVEPLDTSDAIRNYRIITGRKDYPVSFIMRVVKPSEEGKFPAIVDGDLCWRYAFDKEYLQAATQNGVMLVLFNRLELAPDRGDVGRSSPLYRCYPEYTFGALAAWAWGYSRCVDALEKLDIADLENIAFCGHSRGGKVALLAGILDQRAAIVNPNDSGAGGTGCYRVDMLALQENGNEERNEKLADLIQRFPFWFGPELAKYVDREEALPFDQHYLKALVAPRVLLETEAASDIWANPIGSWQTAMAAKEVYKFLGAEDNLLLYWRKGYHQHDVKDLAKLVTILNQKKAGAPYDEGSFCTPFVKQERIFDWGCPE